MNLIKRYENTLRRKNKSEETIEIFESSMLKLFRWLYKNDELAIEDVEDERIVGLTIEETEGFRDYLQKSVKVTSGNTYLSYILAFENWLVNIKAIEGLPFEKGESIKFEVTKVKPIAMKKEELKKLLEHVSTKMNASKARDYVLMTVMAGAGTRINETLNLKPSNIRKTHEEDGTSYQVDINQGKGNKNRITILPTNVGVMLEKYIIKNDIEDNEPIFKISVRAIEKNMKKYLSDCGLSCSFTPHKLRHTFATLLWEKGIPIEEISKYLGHSNTSLTAQYYLSVTDKQMTKTAKVHPLSDMEL